MGNIRCPKCRIWWIEVVTRSADGKIVYGLCKKCGQVSVELDEYGDPVKPVKIPEDVVKDNRSRWMSALIKAIRMGLEEEAAYWLSVLIISDGISKWYLARRLLMSVFEDVANVPATILAYWLFAEGIRDDAEQVDWNMYKVTLALCRAPKFFSDDVARQCTKDWLDTEEHPEKYDLYWEDKKTDQDLLVSLKRALEAGNFKHTWLIYNEILSKRKFMDYEELVNNIIGMAPENLLDHVKEYAQIVSESALESARYGDSNSVFMLAQALTVGLNNDEVEVPDEDVEIALKYKEFVRDHWKQDKIRQVPGWALDGVHAGVGDKIPDKRFAGTMYGIKNMVLQYEKYGRLHPDDKGVVYKSYGDWKPEYEKIGERLYKIRSQNGNGFYEVNVVNNNCSCPAFMHRKGNCKHIKILKAKLKIK